MMIEASLQFAADPNAKLLTGYPPEAGVKQIERWIKPASFSAANLVASSLSMIGKHPRPSNNGSSHSENAGENMPRTQPRNAPRNAARGGQGGYNRRFRPATYVAPQIRAPPRGPNNARASILAPGPNDAFVLTGPSYRAAQISPAESRQGQSRATPSSYSHPQAQSPTPSRNEATSSAKTVSRVDRSITKGRFLDWDTMDN